MILQQGSEIVTGIVQRTERKNVIIDLGKAEAISNQSRCPGEEYKFNDRIKTYIIEVKRLLRSSNYGI